ncbi:MAG: phosphoribosylanthranilate isomerase [Gemmataceae bacterium]
MNPNPVRIKVCGVTRPDQMGMLADLGVHAIGLNFYEKSPRYVTPTQAMMLVQAAAPWTSLVGLFIDIPMLRACATAYQLGLDTIQSFAKGVVEPMFPFRWTPAFRVQGAEQLETIRQFAIEAEASAIVLDSYTPGQLGGTGLVGPWEAIAAVQWPCRIILAGGLTPENVAEAIRVVRPWGVDVASGVESAPGVKDPAKVRAFVAAAHAGFLESGRPPVPG